jgi:hypothetical protein
MSNTTFNAFPARARDVSYRALGMIAQACADSRASHSTSVCAQYASEHRTILSHHGPDRLLADAVLGGQSTQALGRGEIADRCLLLRRELASTDAIPRT